MKRLTPILFAIAVSVANATEAMAQCAMCRTSLAGSENGAALTQGLNSGILFLVSVPFLVTGLIGLRIYWLNRRGSVPGSATAEVT